MGAVLRPRRPLPSLPARAAFAGLPERLARDWGPPPPLAEGVAVCAPCADNANVLGGDAASAQRLLSAIAAELEGAGLAVHERAKPTRDFPAPGLHFDGKRSWIRPTTFRSWRLWFALGSALRAKAPSPDHLRRLLGHLCHHFCLRRRLLSAPGDP